MRASLTARCRRAMPQELAGKEIVPSCRSRSPRNRGSPTCPVAGDFATPDKRKFLRLVMAPNAIARPFAAPPGVPAARLEALRAAFDKATADPAFLAEAQKANLDVASDARNRHRRNGARSLRNAQKYRGPGEGRDRGIALIQWVPANLGRQVQAAHRGGRRSQLDRRH